MVNHKKIKKVAVKKNFLKKAQQNSNKFALKFANQTFLIKCIHINKQMLNHFKNKKLIFFNSISTDVNEEIKSWFLLEKICTSFINIY